jgi:hypothetical protein
MWGIEPWTSGCQSVEPTTVEMKWLHENQYEKWTFIHKVSMLLLPVTFLILRARACE